MINHIFIIFFVFSYFSKLKNIRPDYEQVLVQLYQKRMKSNNTKFCEYRLFMIINF